ncbi:uncharacterized protein [Diadema setosum]|uniref:uncharacterized protein n=1 Tax=Diadema setosum TaxID=31175 RepID=UPI003B3A0D00
MEHGDVIDIDDLLGVSSPEASLPLEEYDLDTFLEAALHGEEKKGKVGRHGHKTKGGKSSKPPGNHLAASTPSASGTSEEFLDSLLSSVGQSVLTHGEESVDVNWDELRRFIAEFQSDGDLDVLNASQSPGTKQLDDGVSVSSSNSESVDGSLASGEGVGGGVKGKQNRKVMRGMRLLVASLLRSKSSPAMASPTLRGEEERQKDLLRRQKMKEKSKRREEKALVRQASEGYGSQDSVSLVSNATPVVVPSSVCSRGVELDNGQRNSPKWDTYLSGLDEQTARLFHIAVEEDRNALEQYLRSNPSLRDSRDHLGNTLLHMLCRQGKLESVRWLASGLCGHHVTLENNNCFTPTALAVKYGRLECVEWMISETKARGELQSQDNRWSLLHIAARFGQEPCLRWLLQFMQNVDIHLDVLDRHGNSPVHLAARHGHLRCLQTLVEFNCDITMANGKKHTACSLATKYQHDTCAQFLVVTETCISLSEQVTQLRKDLREYHQEKTMLKARLDDAIACSEALVRLQPVDTAHRIDEVQRQYVDLTNLLVKRIDDMHQQRGGANSLMASAGRSGAEFDELGDEVKMCKRRASELQEACHRILEDEQTRRSSSQEKELSRIQETLHKLQHQAEESEGRGQRSRCEEHGIDVEHLKSMRERLSEVSLMRAASPAIMNISLADKQDDISLSSSYTSLSSSSSSLSLMWNSPLASAKPTLQKQVSWEDQRQSGESSASSSRGTKPVENGLCLTAEHRAEQEELKAKVTKHLNDLISGKTSSHGDSKQSQSSKVNQYYSSTNDEKGYATPTNSSPIEGVYAARLINTVPTSHRPSDRTSVLLSNKANSGHMMSMKSTLPDVINLIDGPVSQDSPVDGEKSSKFGNLSSSWHGGGSSGSSSGLAKRKPLLSRLRLTNGKDSISSLKHARHSSENSVLSGVKIPLGGEEEVLHRPVSNSGLGALSVPGFMRKLRPTARQPSTEVNVQAEPVAASPSDVGIEVNGDTFHPRLNSDSSLSSTSSDVVWSDTDRQDGQETAPMYKQRAGILNRTRRTGEGNRKSRNRHIKFALDEDKSPSSPTPDSSYRRRDLSPIYESESRRQQREQERESAPLDIPAISPPTSNLNAIMLGHREYRVNYYSSDDDYETESPPPQDSPPIIAPTVDGTNTEHQEQNHNGTAQQDSLLDGEDRFWYESSEDEETGETGDVLNASMGSPSDRHICYL